MKVYIAAPLFSDAEKKFNEEVDRVLKGVGFDTFLPQRDGYEKAQLVKAPSSDLVNKKIFEKDLSEIKKCDILLMILDGRVPDEGACVELGIAFALGKKCLGLKTDSRTLIAGEDNPMILGCLEGKTAKSFDELRSLLQSITRKGKS